MFFQRSKKTPFNPIALRMAKTPKRSSRFECHRVKFSYKMDGSFSSNTPKNLTSYKRDLNFSGCIVGEKPILLAEIHKSELDIGGHSRWGKALIAKLLWPLRNNQYGHLAGT